MSCESETIDALRESGHRITPQRMMILTLLRHAPGHLSAGDIYDKVREDCPYVDISTVYRTLNVLRDLRLVSETNMGGRDATFEWIGGEPHHHLICRKCDGVTSLDHAYVERLCAQIARDMGFQADLAHLAIFGLCRECQQALVDD
jgi:Fur family ferric uptake transcriptional regulator